MRYERGPWWHGRVTPCHLPQTCVCRTTAPEKNNFLKSGHFIVCLFVLFFRHVCVINKASFQCSRLHLAVPEDLFGICSRWGYRTAETSLLVHKFQSKRFSWGGRWVRGEVLYPTPEAALGNGLGCLGFLQGFHATLDCTPWAQTPISVLSSLSKPTFCSTHPSFAETSASQRCGLLSLLTYLNMFNLYSSRQPRKQTIFSSQLINKAHDFTLWVWLRQGPKFNIIDII